MSEKSSRHCRYTSIKIDADVLLFMRLAIADVSQAKGEQVLMQEWASDILNKAAASLLKKEPIHRKPPPPRKKRKSAE